MGYIAAVLLLHMPPENAFWMLVSLMENFHMRSFFTPGMPEVHKSVYKANRILKTKYSRVWQSLSEKGVRTFMFCTQWFLTIFSCSFPLALTARIWDSFFSEGTKIIYRVFLSMMSLLQIELVRLPFEHVMQRLRQFQDEVDPDTLVNHSFRIRLKRQWLNQYEKEYLDSPKEEFLM